MSMSAEEFVAHGSAVAADYINLKIGIPECIRQVAEQVEYPGIVLVNLAGPVVAQIVIQSRQGFLVVTFATAVDDVQALSGMCVKKMQAVRTVRSVLLFRFGRSAAD
jgi:hypothetical protein